MRYTVELNSAAQRYNKNLDHQIGARISEAIDALEETPRPVGCVKLSGQEDLFRIRVGAYRIVYAIDDAAHTVTVQRIQHRREVYR